MKKRKKGEGIMRTKREKDRGGEKRRVQEKKSTRVRKRKRARASDLG